MSGDAACLRSLARLSLFRVLMLLKLKSQLTKSIRLLNNYDDEDNILAKGASAGPVHFLPYSDRLLRAPT